MKTGVQLIGNKIDKLVLNFQKVNIDEDIDDKDKCFCNSVSEEGLSKITNIKFERKANLTERSKNVVSQIASKFYENIGKDASNVKRILLRALSGEGKTTIAIEFAYKYGKQFIATFRIDFSKNIEEQYVEIAENELGIIIPVDLRKDEIKGFYIESVKKYIDTHSTFVIFDNVHILSDCEPFLPKGKARTIILSTNLMIKEDALLNEIIVPKLRIDDSLKILLQGLSITEPERGDAKKMAEKLGHLPFNLESANHYLRTYSDVSISLLYKELEEESIKWEGLQREKGFNFIHEIPSTITLIELKVNKLDENNEIDNFAKTILSVIGCLSIAGDTFYYTVITNVIGFQYKNDDINSVKKISQVKNRLSELGLVTLLEDKFEVHTTIQDYLKEFVFYPFHCAVFCKYKIDEISDGRTQYDMLGWFPNENFDIPINKLLDKLLKIVDKLDVEQISFILKDCLYDYSMKLIMNHKDEENVLLMNKALELCNLIKKNPVIESREILEESRENALQKEAEFLLAVSLHKLSKYDEALFYYEKNSKDGWMFDYASAINLPIYAAHIFRNKKEVNKAIKIYEDALWGNEVVYNRNRNEHYFVLQKIRILIFIRELCYEFDLCDKYKDIEEQIDKELPQLLIDKQTHRFIETKTLSEEEKDSIYSKGDCIKFNKYPFDSFPFEIRQAILNAHTHKPEKFKFFMTICARGGFLNKMPKTADDRDIIQKCKSIDEMGK